MRRALRRLRHRLFAIALRLEQRHGGEMQHTDDRASVNEWGTLG